MFSRSHYSWVFSSVVLRFASTLQALPMFWCCCYQAGLCLYVAPSHQCHPALHCRVVGGGKKKWGLPIPEKKKPSMVPLPPSPSLHAGLDELARDKRLCGPAMKGLLTILHPPEALPAGHRLPECHSLSRPQSQHAPLPFSANPCHPRASL